MRFRRDQALTKARNEVFARATSEFRDTGLSEPREIPKSVDGRFALVTRGTTIVKEDSFHVRKMIVNFAI